MALDSTTLTLLVINGLAAAMVGRLRSLPLTFAGGLVLGLAENYAVGYLPGSIVSQIKPVVPMIFLFVVLLVLPPTRIDTTRVTLLRAPRIAGFLESVGGGAVLVVVAWLVSAHLSTANLLTAGHGMVLGIVMLSLVILVGYGGQVSLCQLTFAGIGAFTMGKIAGGGSIIGILAATGISAAVGAVIALPALRLRGLYLALSTLAFAEAMDYVFFQNTGVFGSGGSVAVGRVHVPGIPTQSNRAFFVVLAVVFAAAGVAVLTLRRSSFGRRLSAMSDSPAACATLGLNLTWTKLTVFAISAGLAGLAGALYGGQQGQVGANDFPTLSSLVLLLLATVWGIRTVSGMLFAGLLFAIFPDIQSHLPDYLRNLTYLAVGLGAIGIGRNPNGILGTRSFLHEWRQHRAVRARPPEGQQGAEVESGVVGEHARVAG